MTAAGFANYRWEWWHWSWGDLCWVVTTGSSRAHYGTIEPAETAFAGPAR